MILAKDVPVALAKVPMAFNQDLKALIPSPAIQSDYLLYMLESRKQELARLVGTSAHGTRRMGTDALERLLVPVAPLEEQAIIAQTLNACDAKVQALIGEVELFEELFHALIEELMSGRLSTLPLLRQQDPGDPATGVHNDPAAAAVGHEGGITSPSVRGPSRAAAPPSHRATDR